MLIVREIKCSFPLCLPRRYVFKYVCMYDRSELSRHVDSLKYPVDGRYIKIWKGSERGLREKDRSRLPNDEVSFLPSLIFIFYLLPRSFFFFPFFLSYCLFRINIWARRLPGWFVIVTGEAETSFVSTNFLFTTRTEYFLTRVENERSDIIWRYDVYTSLSYF